jgi:hypothetical protein
MHINFKERPTDPKLFYSTDTILHRIIMSESNQKEVEKNYIIKSFIICTLHNAVKPRMMTRMRLESSIEGLHTKSYSGKIQGRDT